MYSSLMVKHILSSLKVDGICLFFLFTKLALFILYFQHETWMCVWEPELTVLLIPLPDTGNKRQVANNDEVFLHTVEFTQRNESV